MTTFRWWRCRGASLVASAPHPPAFGNVCQHPKGRATCAFGLRRLYADTAWTPWQCGGQGSSPLSSTPSDQGVLLPRRTPFVGDGASVQAIGAAWRQSPHSAAPICSAADAAGYLPVQERAQRDAGAATGRTKSASLPGVARVHSPPLPTDLQHPVTSAQRAAQRRQRGRPCHRVDRDLCLHVKTAPTMVQVDDERLATVFGRRR